MGSIAKTGKFSKKNRLLLTILICSIAVVFSFLAVLIYINYYARVNIILTTITWYEDGGVKNVTEYDIVTIKKGRSVNSLPKPSVEGYTFGGWYFDKDCLEEFDYSRELNENIQIYGKLNLVEYSIELVLDDSVKVSSNATREYDYNETLTIEDVIKLPKANDAITLDDGTETSVAEYKALSREGYTFEGWGFSSTAYKTVAFDYRMSAQNLTFYAIWKPIQVELEYWTPSLTFAETNPQSGDVQRRISRTNGGLDYTGRHGIYISETIEYNTKVNIVTEPTDEFNNFEFKGWYLDPEFTIPLKFAQLYIRNGYFSLTREKNLNILQDELYFDDGHILDDEQLENISQYSSSDENNSYIKVFAKWELKKYTVKFHLNLPDAEAYIKTAQMRPIVYADTPLEVYSDNADTLQIKTTIYQGQDLTGNAGVLYNDGYFKNVVYIKNDLTGLPLYTINNWNSQKDGMGYNITNSGHKYFDKSNFTIDNDEIIIYAQWTSYYRVNYYLTGATDNSGVSSGNNILLATVNVTNNTIEMPQINSLVSDITDRKINFTQNQQEMNQKYVDMDITYYTPLNKTFIGWSNDTTYSTSSQIYIENVTYSVGTDVSRNTGIYLNAPVRNLYTTWINNVNAYRYDLGEDGLEKADFSKNAISSSMASVIYTNLDGRKTYIEYVYETTNTHSTLQTIYNEEFLVTKMEGEELYSLNGWKLADGTKIDGLSSQEIKFNRSPLYVKYINNSICDITKYQDIETGVYVEGNKVINHSRYYTRYDSNEDRSYIILKAQNYTILVFDAMWVKNIKLTYSTGVDDAVWTDGYNEESLSNIAGGSVYMQFSDPEGLVSRPYYKFYGWSLVNREDSETIQFDKFIEENVVYYPGTRYYEAFEEDTMLFAVWRPIVYTITVYTQTYNSLVNSSCGKFLIAKERFLYNGNSVADELILNNKSVEFENVEGETIITSLTTSAVAGYGLSAWTNSDGEHLQQTENKYIISVFDDVNGLFEQYGSSDYNYINIYPYFSIMKYTITFVLYGSDVNNDGIDEIAVNNDIPGMVVTYTDMEYGTSLKALVPKIYNSYFENGYTSKGWNITGDVDYSGNDREDYLLSIKDVSSGNLLIRSNLTLTLVAERLSYTIKFIFENPDGETTKIVNHDLYYRDSLNSLKEEIDSELESKQYLGYNFKYWQVIVGGSTDYLTQDNLGTILVSAPMDLYSKYERADINIIYNFESDSEVLTEERDSEFLSVFSLDTTTFTKQPKKDGYILKGWALDDLDQEKYFKVNTSITINASEVGSYLVRPDGANYYILNLYAKWVEVATLTFDISNVNISYANFPTSLTYEKGEKVFFTDISYISSLTNATISQLSGLGTYAGIWVDSNGKEYNVTLPNTFISMDSDLTITPKFNPKTFYISYNYYYGGRYYTIDSLTTSTTEQYVDAPVLLTKADLDSTLSQITELSNYRSVEYYLSKDKYELRDSNYKFDMGATFDFLSNASYLNSVNQSTFEFYIVLQELTSLTYHYDRDETAVQVKLTFDAGLTHVIGDTDSDGVVDFVPTKKGYEFAGWCSSLALNYVQYYNADTMATGSLTALYPVWKSEDVKIIYCDTNGYELGYSDGWYFTDSITIASWTQEGKKLVGWKLTIDGAVEYTAGSSLLLDDIREDYAVEDGEIFVLKLYAEWQTATYTITFEVYDASGNKSVLYGKKDSTITSTETIEEYDSTTIVNYTFPSTIESYTDNGQKYQFTNRWKCGAGSYITTTGDIAFVKDFVFTPVYEKIHTLTFMYGENKIFEVEVKDGSVYYFNSSDLINATSEYNTNTLLPLGSKIVAYTSGGTTYDSSKYISVSSSMTFTAQVVDLVNIVIYRDLSYDGSTFSFANSVNANNVELSTTINLDDNSYKTTLSECSTIGFVVSDNANYSYNPDAIVSTGNYLLSNSGVNKGSTIYFYPVIQTSIVYYVNGSLSDSEEVLFGKEPTKTDITEVEGQYFTEWRKDSLTGEEYTKGVVYEYIELYTIGKPFLQLKVSSTDNFIDNSDSEDLVINKLKPTTEFNLPTIDKVILKQPLKYSIIGWYISYNGEYAMNGSVRREYSLGQTTTLASVISDIGKSVDDIDQVSFDMHPIIDYTLKTLTIVESDNISYTFDVSLQDTTGLDNDTITALENSFVVDDSGYKFNLLYNSAITYTSADDIVKFTAYLVDNGGNVVITNYQPTTALIKITKNIDTGYTSEGWKYVGTNRNLVSGDKVTEHTSIQAQTAEADEVSLSVKLRYFDGTNTIDVNEDNIETYDDYFYIDTSNKYEYSVETMYDGIISFVVVVQNGYEIYNFVDGSGNTLSQNISTSGVRITFTHQVGSETQLYVVVRKALEFKPIISINSSNISDYDKNNITDSSYMYIEYKEDVVGSSWTKLYTNAGNYQILWSEFSSGYQYTNAVGVDDLIKIYTNFDSRYYYVKTINVYNDGSLDNASGGTNSIEGNNFTIEVSVTGILEIELVLAERTYSINYYNENDTLVDDTVQKVSDSILIQIPSISKTGYELRGFKLSSGTQVGNVQFIEYITTDKEFTLQELQLNTTDRNVDNQNTYLLLTPVWVKTLQTLTISTDKGYFEVNGESLSEVSVNIPYNSTLSFDKVEIDGVITSNILSFVSEEYSINANGEVSITSETITIVFVPYGSWDFVDGYINQLDSSIFSTTTITSDITLSPNVEAGEGTLTISINDSGTYNNSNLLVGSAEFTINTDASTEQDIIYDEDGNLNVIPYSFNTEDSCVIELNLESGFSSVSEIQINGYKLSDYPNLDDFKSISNLDVEVDGNKLTFVNLIYNVTIIYTLEREEFATYIQVVDDSTLSDVFSEISVNGATIASVGTIEAKVGESTLLDAQKLRKEAVYSLTYNLDYFEIDSIYYVDNGVNYIVFGAGASESLSSFDPTTNQITIVYGGNNGNDITLYIKLKLRSFNVILHSIDSVYSASADYSDYLTGYTPDDAILSQKYDYNSSIELGATTLFEPNNTTYNGINYEFVGWLYYNGNYENDSPLDSGKLVQLPVSWTFNATNGNLHIVSSWRKLFNVNFEPTNDGFTATQNNLPSDLENASIDSELTLTTAERNGFTFEGYAYSCGGTTYYLRYNGTQFTAPQDESGQAVSTISSFNSSDIRLSALLTSDMVGLSNMVVIVPIWSRNALTLTIVNDSNQGTITTYSYVSGSYEEGEISPQYYNTLVAGTIELNGTNYNCLYVKDGTEIIGVIVANPKTENYYKFDKFQVEETTISTYTLDGDTEVNVLYAEDYVPHVLNLTWDKPYDGVSYVVNNTGTNPIKIEPYNNGIIEEVATILSAGESITFTNTYDKVIIYALRGSSINGMINLNGYHYNTDDSEIVVEIAEEYNIFATSTSYVLKANRVNVNLSQYMLDNLTNTSSEGGSYKVGYFAPIIDDVSGLIIEYETELTYVTISSETDQITDIVSGTKLYFEKVSTTYEIVQLLNGNNDITNIDTNASSVYLTLPQNSGEYDVKVVFDYEYALVNFVINEKSYASAYFKTTSDYSANEQLVAFAQIVVNGYEISDISGLFSDISILTNSSDSDVKSLILKSSGVGKEYYTEGELISLFKHDINKNIAINYYDEGAWTNVWFEEFGFGNAYLPMTGITIDDLFVGAGVKSVSFVATISDALNLYMTANLVSADYGATPNGSFIIETDYTSTYAVLGSSQIGYDGYYSILNVKVKDNTTLPKLTITKDENTYTSSSEIEFSEKLFSSTDDTGLLATNGSYTYEQYFSVKHIKILLDSSDNDSSTNLNFEQVFSNTENPNYKVLEVNYAMTFADILSEYGLQTSYTTEDAIIYNYDGLYRNGERIDDERSVEEFLHGLENYNDGLEVNLTARYVKSV